MKLAPQDNVAVALRPLSAGEAVTIDGNALTVDRDIAIGHKIAACDIAAGATILEVQLPDRHRDASDHGRPLRSHAQREERLPADVHAAVTTAPTLTGFLRADGRKGIRNVLGRRVPRRMRASRRARDRGAVSRAPACISSVFPAAIRTRTRSR